MKRIKVILLIMLSCFELFSQSQPFVRVGVGFPVFFKNSFYDDDVTHGPISSRGIQYFIEKPLAIRIKNQNFFLISPGLFYAFYSEKKQSSSSALGGYSSGSYKHNALGVQSKFSYDLTTLSNRNNIFYSGFITGFYLYTATQGRESGSVRTEPPQSWSSKTDGDGKLFFDSYCVGIISGIRFEHDSFLKPAIELAFYPNYARLLDQYTPREEVFKRNSMLSISIIFGFGTKKATQTE